MTNKPTDQPAGELSPEADAKTPDVIKAELANYVEEFGATNGPKWYFDGRPEVDCYKEELAAARNDLAELKEAHATELAAVNAKAAELSERLKQVADDGEANPADFTSGEAGEQDSPGETDPGEFSGRLSPNMAKYAAALKKPTA